MEEVDANFLPLIYEILKSVDKESTDISQKVTDLKTKLQKVREDVEKLPGIEYSAKEQEQQIDELRQSLNSKTELLKKYKNLGNFDVLPQK